jgi:putative transposase
MTIRPELLDELLKECSHRIFPSDEAVFKVVYLAIQNIARKWTMPIHNWKPALHCFAIEFAVRFPQ